MNGTTLQEAAALAPAQVADTDWKVAGTGDLDGDGHADLVWQNVVDGRVSVWLMLRGSMREGVLLSIPQVPDTDSRIRAAGDMNGDGRADLLWQHQANGRVAIWMMDGPSVMFATLITPPEVLDTGWRIVGTGDFNQDASRDIVWHHQMDGRIAVWFMDGTAEVSGTATNPGQVTDVNWKIRAVGDLNGGAHPDLIWQHVADGRVSAWFMNGLNLIDGILMTPSVVSDTSWHIVGPR